MFKEKIYTVSRGVLIRITILTFKSCLVISLFVLRAILFAGTHLQSCLEYIALKSNVIMPVSDPVEEVDPYSAKFSDEEIKIMAKKVDSDSTIKEIEERFGISYRQANKVKNMVNNLSMLNA